jgi:hypothetical protein
MLTACYPERDEGQSNRHTSAQAGQIADRPMIFHDISGIGKQTIDIAIDSGNLVVKLRNNDSNPVYIPGDVVSGLTYKDPHFHLIISNNDAQELGVCGNFEITNDNYEPLIVNSGKAITFSIPIDEIKNQYCTSTFVAQGVVSVRSGENIRDIISKSNSVKVMR